MFKKDIYRYKDDNGRVVISPYRPDCDCEHMYRLIGSSSDYRITNYTTMAYCIDIREKDLELWHEVHKDDLETPISQNEELKARINETYVSLEDLIMVGFSAIDELYTIIEELNNKGDE